jgi:putative ABC transport system permease protein
MSESTANECREPGVSMIYLKWILREWRNNKRFSALFIVNMALGVLGYISLDSINNSLNQELATRSKTFLSADFAISSRRKIPDEDLSKIRAQLPAAAIESEVLEFFSMASNGANSRLIQVKAVSDNYPFYGEVKLSSGRALSNSAQTVRLADGEVVVYPELLIQLGSSVGDEIKIGGINFKVVDTILEDSTQTFRMGSIAPKVYARNQPSLISNFVKEGSTVSYAYLFKFTAPVDLALLQTKISEKVADPGIRMETPESAAEDTGRIFAYLGDYLGLVSIVAFFLAQIGGVFLFRSLIEKKSRDIAIMKSLGLQSSAAILIYTTYIISLGLTAALLAFLASQFIARTLSAPLAEFLPFQIDIAISVKTVLVALFITSAGAILGCLPFLGSLNQIKLTELLQESSGSRFSIKGRSVLLFLPGILFFSALSFFEANSYKVAGAFLSGLFASFLLLGALGFAGIYIIGRTNIKRPWYIRHSFLFLSREGRQSIITFVTIGLGTLLISLLPQVKTGIQSELETNDRSKIPSLFLFDIQEDQADKLVAFVQDLGVKVSYNSPMVRARLLTVNGSVFERAVSKDGFKTREEEAEARFRNRGFNLSYRADLTEAEEIVKGQDWDLKSEDPIADLSLEIKFAERLGLKLGDVLKFDVQGVEIEGRIVNFRTVKWTSFQPNFFVLFEPGYLEPAPKTFLSALPPMPEDEKMKIQNQLAKEFPNVSVVDVSRSIKSALTLIDKMSEILSFMAYLSLIAGFVVMYSISSHQARQRRWDLNMLKVFGAKFRHLQIYFLSEFALVGLVASIIGSGLGALVSVLLSVVVFNGTIAVSFSALIYPVVIVTGVAVFIALVSSRYVLNESPKDVFLGG